MSSGKFGALYSETAMTEFRFWAPDAEEVSVVINGSQYEMARDENEVFSIRLSALPGDKYKFLVNRTLAVPDPASRQQYHDIHDESLVVKSCYDWKNLNWKGRPWHETIVYELHPGILGGFSGIIAQLPRLANLGITAIELMPIADFPGKHNWGYDGVLIYAPDTAYGTDADLKRLIDTAHGLNIQVFLDVVYNHFGPDGNYLNAYAKSFFQSDVQTPWGAAINFTNKMVRRFFIENALYWLNEYRFDGLRFDAVHAIVDTDFLHDLVRDIRMSIPLNRHVHLIIENENNDASLLSAKSDSTNFDAQWSDDWHHCVHVLLTGEAEGYYRDYQNPAEQLARCMSEGFAYQGEISIHSGGKPRGHSSSHLPSTAFVICLQNHDQIGNRALGERLFTLASPQLLRAAIALLLFTPQIPMIFMGEEWGETRPFLYFTDHNAELGIKIREGRRREFAHFKSFSDPQKRDEIPNPNSIETFNRSCLSPTENDWTEFYKVCLKIRREHIIPRIPGCHSLGASALSDSAVFATWRMNDDSILSIAVNFGTEPIFHACITGNCLFASNSDGCDINVIAPYSTIVWMTSND